MLLTRARSAERRCAQQDIDLVCRQVAITSAQYDAEQAHGQVEANRMVSDAWIESVEQDRDRHAARAADAEAACRAATADLVKAEARIDEMTAAVERARECVRTGLSACSDEDVAEEFVRRFDPTRIELRCGDGGRSVANTWCTRWESWHPGHGTELHNRAGDALVRAKRLAEKG